MSILPCKLITSSLVYSIPFLGTRTRLKDLSSRLKNLRIAFINSAVDANSLTLARNQFKTFGAATILSNLIKLTVSVALCYYFSFLFILFAIKFAGHTYDAFSAYEMAKGVISYPLGKGFTAGLTPEEREAQIGDIQLKAVERAEKERERYRQMNPCSRICYVI